MKKKLMLIFISIIVVGVFLWGCTIGEQQEIPDTEPGIIGYVMDMSDGRILVISSEVQDFSATGGIEEFYNAIWFSKAPENIKIGDQVRVWFDSVAESYPGQSEVKHIEVMPEEKPDGADLSESEAINKAVISYEKHHLAVKSLVFIKESDKWQIKLKDVMNDLEYDIEIEDEK